jgi:DNA repair protein RecN (Recombination protein N)
VLKSLSIKNYALIESVDVSFERGLNIITGETGAGKSILIDALSLLLGERASVEVVRKGTEKAIVEGVFAIAGIRAATELLVSSGLEEADELIVRREVSAKGQSRCFVNDTPVQLSVLKAFGELLVDLHGQHEHQSLLRTDTHIDFVDHFGGLEGLLEEYQKEYRTLGALYDQLDNLRDHESQLKQKRSLYEFQIKEIDAVSPVADEEERLENELRILENSEKLYQSTADLHQLLYESENAVHDLLIKARNQLENLTEIDRTFAESKTEAESAAAIVNELAKYIQSYNARIEFNPERLEEIRERLGALSLLKKKYGGSVEAILSLREAIGKEFALAENFELEIRKLEERITDSVRTCSQAAERLSSKRRELTPKITRGVSAELAKLGVTNARFDVSIKNQQLDDEENERAFVQLGKELLAATTKGIDSVEFLLSTNVGEELKPLAKVASGGEVSRVMLALKSVLAKSDRLPLLIFDEIDVGISGRVAQAVGKSMKNLSEFHQLIAITHLPQIAGLADQHFVVEKVEKKNRTVTQLRKMEIEERVEEIAKLLSGSEVTDAGLQSARELMGVK